MDGERTRGMLECAGKEREHGRGGRDKKRVKGRRGERGLANGIRDRKNGPRSRMNLWGT